MAAGKKLFKKSLFKKVLTGFGVFVLLWGTAGCSATVDSSASSPALGNDTQASAEVSALTTAQARANEDLSTAVFAGGCFWCMEQPFDELPGVASTTSGYTGGTTEDPTYSEVSSGGTGHVEAVEVRYDPEQVSYEALLDTFWHNVDPLDNRGQFCDKGSQYRSAIFYETPEQAALAESSKEEIASELSEQSNQPVATDILPAATFYDAEDYHQDYYKTRPVRYKFYRNGCGRDQRLAQVWGDDAPSH